MMSTKFKWVPLFQEMAQWVLAYRNRQAELCSLLTELGFKGNLEDEGKRGKKPLKVMDPFTFFAFFQKIKNQTKRKAFLEALKEKVGFKSFVPANFDGLPSAQPMALWYFPFEKKRTGNELNVLWNLAEQAVKGELKAHDFDAVFAIHGVRIAKLSQGLFWLNPTTFFPIDAHQAYLEDNGISCKDVNSLPTYLSIVRQVKDKFTKPLYEVSHDAWAYSQETNKDKKPEVSNSSNNTDISDWITKYKLLITDKLPDAGYNEIYKWRTVQHFQNNWSDSHIASTIHATLKNSFNKENNNLWSGINFFPYGMLLGFAERNGAEVSAMFKNLYDETIPLPERFQFFYSKSDELLKDRFPQGDKVHYQSDRVLILYLTLRFPEKYFLYKSNMFKTFCELTDFWSFPKVKKKDTFKRVESYLQMAEEVRKVLVSDSELLKMHHARLPNNITFQDNEHLLTQDFIYAVTTYLNKEGNGTCSIIEMEQLFKEYLQSVIPGGVRTYLSAIPTINTIAVENDLLSESVYEIQSTKELEAFLVNLNDLPDYQERNRVGHNKFSSALGKYQSFLEELTNEESHITHNKESSMALNQIFFGPPGTGKTFNSIYQAIAILESKSINDVVAEERAEIKRRFDQYQKEGRIVFTTFHQSMSYEDFIEGIKPVTIEEEVIYEVKDGIFKTLCTEASFSIAQSIQSASTVKALDFSSLYDQFVDSIENSLSFKNTSVEIPTKSGGHIIVEGISPQGNILIKHIDGSRTYTISKQRLIILDQNIGNLDAITNLDTTFRSIIGGSNSSAYYAVLKVIRSLQPIEKPEKRIYSTEDKLGALQALSLEDYKKSSGLPYVIIIDEINRGNISQIFGELITLIEDDKRLGREEALEVTLPYSKNKFGVPQNIYIIGTMNTADRSVEALDTALRRRFSFKEILPDATLIATHGKLKDKQGKVAGIDLAELFTTINNRIEKLLDKDHLIGHSYFMNVADLEELKLTFQNKINPLLQEYFYGDFGKIGLVIGTKFFQEASLKTDNESKFFAEFPEYETSDLIERKAYRLMDVTKMSDDDFKMAINKLLRK